MSEMKKGESVDILAPLGNGFKIEKGKRYCLIGGGIGVPPMLYTAKQCENPLVITGFRNKDLIILQDDFKKAGAELVLTTDDGSAGLPRCSMLLPMFAKMQVSRVRFLLMI